MGIPDYFLAGLYAHYRRIVEYSRHDPGDFRTADAMRLARKELRRLERYLNYGKKPDN